MPQCSHRGWTGRCRPGRHIESVAHVRSPAPRPNSESHVASVPVTTPDGERLAALDLYSASPDAADLGPTVEDGLMIADRIVAVLFCGRGDGAPTAIPSTDQWLSSAVGNERMSVWTAVGMLMSHARSAMPMPSCSSAATPSCTTRRSTRCGADDDAAALAAEHDAPSDQVRRVESAARGRTVAIAAVVVGSGVPTVLLLENADPVRVEVRRLPVAPSEQRSPFGEATTVQ